MTPALQVPPLPLPQASEKVNAGCPESAPRLPGRTVFIISMETYPTSAAAASTVTALPKSAISRCGYMPLRFMAQKSPKNKNDTAAAMTGRLPVVKRSISRSSRFSLPGKTARKSSVSRHDEDSRAATVKKPHIFPALPADITNKTRSSTPSATMPLALPCVTRVAKPRST